MSDAYNLYTAGLPAWAFTFAGLALFLVGFIVALYTAVTKAATHAVREMDPNREDHAPARGDVARTSDVQSQLDALGRNLGIRTKEHDELKLKVEPLEERLEQLRAEVSDLRGKLDTFAPKLAAHESVILAFVQLQRVTLAAANELTRTEPDSRERPAPL